MKRILKSLAFVLIAVSLGSGQTAKGSISGTVSDSFGAVIPGAEVKLVRLSDEKEENAGQTTSDYEGGYSFSNVPLGVYELRVKSVVFYRIFRKRIELTSSRPVRKDFEISIKPCSEEVEIGKFTRITDSDRAEIVRELFNLAFPDQQPTEKIILVPRNIEVAWLSASQKAKLNIMTRDQVQKLADKDDNLSYHWVSPLKQSGGCVEVSMNEGVAVNGQIEDANMSGGGTVYEFKKIAGRWIGQALMSWIS